MLQVANVIILSLLLLIGGQALAAPGQPQPQGQQSTAGSSATTPAVGAPQMSADKTEISYVEAFVQANKSSNCINLYFEGVCVFFFVRVDYYYFTTEVEVGIYTSMEFSHFNPDLLVSTYTRLGASPLDMAKLLYGEFQNVVTEPMIGAITGTDAPKAYKDTEQWSGRAAEYQASADASHKGHKSSLKYNETDAIGHPGNFLTYWDELFNGSSLSSSSGGGGGNGSVMSSIGGGAKGVTKNIVGGTISMADTVPKTVEKAVDDVQKNVKNNPSRIDKLFSKDGWKELPKEFSLKKLAGLQFIPETVTNVIKVWQQLQNYIDTWEDTMKAVETAKMLDGALSGQSIEAIFDDVISSSEVSGIFEVMDQSSVEIGDSSSSTGGSFNDEIHMCKTNADVLKPYFLSGLDLLQWRFNIPEIVFPRSYATPWLSGKEKNFVGLPDSTVDLANNWGSLYPRNGFVNQVNGMKTGAVTAVRSVDVVTRPDQYHVYNYLKEKEREKMMNNFGPPNHRYVHPKSFDLTDPETGRWQLLGDKGTECFDKFGDGDYDRSGKKVTAGNAAGALDMSNSKVPWTEGKESDDDAYVYVLWRKYTCCPAPNAQPNSIVHVYTYLTTIPIRKKLL